MSECSTDDEEHTEDKVAARIALVRDRIERDRMRVLCYAAAMSRRWMLPAETFEDMSMGPRKWILPPRQWQYRSARENGGVKTLVEMCLDTIDGCYEVMGDLCGPEKRYAENSLAVPTAFEHNNALCIVEVKKQRVIRVNA